MSFEEIPTESRAVMLKVTVEDESSPITLTCSNGESIEVENSGEFVIKTNGEYTITATTEEGEIESRVVNVTTCKTETYSAIQGENTPLTIDGYKVTIPAGFAYGTSENVGHVNTGLVITDKVDSKGNSIGNEFVWVPVQVLNEMARLQEGSTENYRGVLYNFNSDPTQNTEIAWSATSENYREPAILSDKTYGEEANSSRIKGWTETLYQEEYNKMIKSVDEYEGFYVARYEMGIEDGKSISKLAVTPTSAHDSGNTTWFGLYNKAKTYAPEKNSDGTNNTSQSVVSNMIWGSQYDAMLNFALKGNDKDKVTTKGNGNYSRSLIKTGLTKKQDSINNIYDLEGNLEEWTQEANSTRNRIIRRRQLQ